MIFSVANTKMTKKMLLVNSYPTQATATKVNTRRIKNQALVLPPGAAVTNTLAVISTTKNLGWASLFILTVIRYFFWPKNFSTIGIIGMGSKMELGRILAQMGITILEIVLMGRKLETPSFFWNDRVKFTGEFYKNEIVGKGKLIYCNGDIYAGEFVAGVVFRTGQYIKANGNVLEVTWEGKFGKRIQGWARGSRDGSGKPGDCRKIFFDDHIIEIEW